MLRNLKNFNLPEIEEKVLNFWKTNNIFDKSLKARKGRKRFIFYEGPPYANGRPGIHHVLARVFKDIITRYKSMAGFYVPRRAGWDTHGLPIELEAEKQLGIKSKKEIEKFGIALFNQKAKESVWQYKDEWEKMTERIGYWLDLKNAYITYENNYIESLWWIFSEISRRGFLKKSFKVVPYCSRCQTPLASHELGMPGVYKKVPDPSVYVKLKIKSRKNEYLLVWTTTPWTLPANVAVAVNPKLTYTKYKIGGDYLWSYNPPPLNEGQNAEVVEKISGKKLLGLSYEPLYNPRAKRKLQNVYKVLAADFVSTEEGTGLVHIAPAFGDDDFNLMQSVEKNFLWDAVPITVSDDGRVAKGYPGAGKFIKDADKDIIADLVKRKLLFSGGKIEHEYPFCWRCGTALLYFARRSWFIEMSRLRDKLAEANQKINWIPDHIKDGRFGEWIREAKDWAISRERYWGTPLPIWECAKCRHQLVAGKLADLDEHDYFRNNFWILRHTEAQHILSGLIASGPERGKRVSLLTKKGVHDAERVAQKLRNKKIHVIYSSPYKRARQVAKIIAKTTGAKIIIDERLRELDAGIFNWRKVGEHKKFFKSPLEEFSKTPPEGENLTDVKKRMFAFLRDVNQKHRRKNILIVGHGDPLWVLEAATKNLTNEETLAYSYIEIGELRRLSLHNWPYNGNAEIDLHRPFVDGVYLECPKCRSKMERTSGVADVWFDSGAMPFASIHYPFENRDLIEKGLAFPADYISEAVDQTRGWFYTLLAVSVVLGHKEPYRNVVCLGLILDKNGQKMSKSKGNVVNPWEVIQKYGVDSIRWHFYTVNPPGEPKRFDEAEVKKTFNRFLGILYNSFVFYETYAAKTASGKRQTAGKNILDKWVLARLNETIAGVTENLERYDIGNAAKILENFAVEDLSRWYIRRSRRRFQKPDLQSDYKQASAILGYVLVEISKLIAPFAPFFAESLYKSLTADRSSSVHLENWPVADKKSVDANLLRTMERVRQIAAMALAKRAESGIKVRQPLAALKIRNPKPETLNRDFLEILKDEINVKEIILDKNLKEEIELDTAITSELREEGLVRELARTVQELRQKAEYKQKDKIALFVEAGSLTPVLEKHAGVIKKEVNAKTVEFKKSDKINAEITTKLEDVEIWVGVRRI